MSPAAIATSALVAAIAALTVQVPAAEIAALTTRLARTGWLAVLALLLTLALGRPGPLRRAMGLATFGLAALHLMLALVSGWVHAPSALFYEPNLRAGATAFAVLAVMALTSFSRVVRALRLGHWKLLHRAVYFAAALILLHVALGSRADPRRLAALAAALAGLLALRTLRGLRRRAARGKVRA